MSIDIDWENLTTGRDGLALAGSIRAFIHAKFQQVALPGFIRAVSIQSFEFGAECPVVELKDVCDPLPDFYGSSSEEDSDSEDSAHGDPSHEQPRRMPPPPPPPRLSARPLPQ